MARSLETVNISTHKIVSHSYLMDDAGGKEESVMSVKMSFHDNDQILLALHPNQTEYVRTKV